LPAYSIARKIILMYNSGMGEVLLDALLDSLKILPFLFLVYVLIEILETKTSAKLKSGRALRGGFAPLLGAGIGLVPQCGFSVMATNLFAKGYLSVGTLLAVYISTSDEAIPILLANPAGWSKLWPLLLAKFAAAVAVGYGAYLVCGGKKTLEETATIADASLDKKDIDDEQAEKESDDIGCCHHHIEKRHNFWQNYVFHPMVHSLKIFAFILIVNVLFGLLLFYTGEQWLHNVLAGTGYFQPFIAGLVGLIPNCASSVVLTELYITEGLTFGSAFAGLSVNAGIALTVLFKQNKNLKQNLLIVVSLYLLSTALGLVIDLIFPSFL